MGNTELLVGEMAQKIAVLKQRLQMAEAPQAPPDHLTACKLDCLMTMLPLVLGGAGAAPATIQAPAMIQAPVDTSKIVKLEGDKATLKAENKVLEHQCDQLKKENKSLREQLAAKPTPEAAPTMTFEEIAAGTFGAKPPAATAPTTDLQAKLERVTRERDQAMAALKEDPRDEGEEVATLREHLARSIPLSQFNDLSTRCQQIDRNLADCIKVRDDCINLTTGVVTTTTEAVTTTPGPTAPPLPVAAEEGTVVMEDDPQIGQGACAPLTDQQRTFRVRKWNVTPDPRTGERVKGTTLRSINAIVSTPLRIPQLDDVGSKSLPVPVKGSLEIGQQFGGAVSRLRDVYQLMRPEIWTGENCGELQAQYIADVKTMLSRLACQLVDALTRKAAANEVSEQVNAQIPDALRAPCDETLLGRLDSLTPGTTPQEAGSAMVTALQTLFQTWMTNVDATDASDTIVKGIFCPILSKVDACTWPTTVNETQALGTVWNKTR